MNEKIYGTGLPRTGTTSLFSALEILGYRTTHYCPITNPLTADSLTDLKYDAYVSSSFLLDPNFSRGIWILLHRKDWLDSVKQLGGSEHDWTEHIESWEKIRTIKRSNVLHYSVEQGWIPLCQFLNQPIPNAPYPYINTHEENLQFNKEN